MRDSLRGWHTAETAKQYDYFALNFPMYRETSADLVKHLTLQPDAHVLDLACGTGVTTAELLSVLGPAGVVWAIDASEQMLGFARQRVVDDRVRWRRARASDAATIVEAGFDAATCNSAIWQLGAPQSIFEVVHAVLRTGGEFACNWGAHFLRDASPPEEPPSALDLPLFAVLDEHGLLPPAAPEDVVSPWSSIDEVLVAASASGLDPVEQWWMSQANSPEATYEWWKTPVFTDWLLPDVPLRRRRELIDEAYSRWEPKQAVVGWWFCLRLVAK